jgi:hypothetical protein
MKRYIAALYVPLFITVLNALCYPTLRTYLSPDVAVVIMNVLRIFTVFAAGWLIVMKNLGGLITAGIAGVVLMMIDYPLISGIRSLLIGQPAGFDHILIAFAVSCWMPLLLGMLGGWAARKRYGRTVTT